MQDGVFARGQLAGFAVVVAARFVGGGVQGDDAVVEFVVGAVVAVAAQDGAHPRQQFGQFEGFDEVVVRAAIEAAQAAVKVVARGEDEYRRGGVLAQLAEYVQPVFFRQAEVEEDEVVVFACGGTQCHRAVFDPIDGVGGVFESGVDGFAYHAVVFGKQDAHWGSWGWGCGMRRGAMRVRG